MASLNCGTGIQNAYQEPKVVRDLSPIQSEIRAANDTLDLLHMRVNELVDRLSLVTVQRGAIASGTTGAVPQPPQSSLGADIAGIAQRISDASDRINEILNSLHL